MGKEEFVAALTTGQPIAVARPGALSVTEILATIAWFNARQASWSRPVELRRPSVQEG